MTVATTLLKPGGYDRMSQMASLLEKEEKVFAGVDADAVNRLVEESRKNPHHVKAVKPLRPER